MTASYYTIDRFALTKSLGYLIKRAAKLASAQAEAAFAGRELTMSHWVTLSLILKGEARSCAELARQLGHNSGATTRLVDQLEERGLVRRCRSSSDRRIVTLELTPAGEAAWTAATPLLQQLWNGALADFTHAEADMLTALLQRLVAGLEARALETGVEA